MREPVPTCVTALLLLAAWTAPLVAQGQDRSTNAAPVSSVPDDYVIGPADVLGVLFRYEKDMSGDVTVRPDGKVTLPLLGDIMAAGLQPEVLRNSIEKAASTIIRDPNVTVIVRTINSRKVFITGEINNPGEYPLTAPRTVMQLIALAGGLTEFADGDSITVLRLENGQTKSLSFDYEAVSRGQRLYLNIALQPGDTVVVP